MAWRHRGWAILVMAVTVASSCADSGDSGSTTTAPDGKAKKEPGAGAPAPGLATDQPCTQTTSLDDGVRDLPYRNDFLEAMVLEQGDFGVAGSFEVDFLNSGYIDNEELTELYGLDCDGLAGTGRITGYSASFQSLEEPNPSALSAVHLFFTGHGATQWVDDTVERLRALPDQADAGVSSVDVRPLEGVGAGGFVVELAGGDRDRTFGLFAEGPLAAWVRDDRASGSAATFDVEAALVRLEERVRDLRARSQDRIGSGDGITLLMSVPVPLSGWGERYQGLEWDWFFGGCIDARERASYSTGDETRRAEEMEEATRFGRVGECGAMYSPPEPESSDEVVRIITWASLHADETGAEGAFADSVSDREERVGPHPEEGLTLGALERFEVEGVGEEAAGTRQRVDDETGGFTDTRVTFRRGRLILSVILHERTDRDATDEVIAVAEKLEDRARALFG